MFEHDFVKYPELTNKQLEELRFVSPHVQIEEDFDATVVKVHDGDTITVSTSFRDFTFPVRFLDINAPELSEEGGKEAAAWLRSKLLGEEVRVLVNKENRVGRYGRLLGRVFFQGLDVGQEELNLGYAKPFSQKNEGVVPEVGYFVGVSQWF